MWTSLVTALLASTVFFEGVASMGKFGERARKHLARQADAATAAEMQKLAKRQQASPRFLNNATEAYKVESLPDVDFDIGEMYSGLIPIGDNASEALFFIFQPTIGEPVDEVTIWLNGGPGCSSLEGFFQENGLFTWLPGTFAPVVNQYSWTNITNMLWVEQPIGTGYSIGTPKATTEEEIAQDFVNFFKKFEMLFGIKNFKIYVTGESYAGRYVPYISAAMLDQNDKKYFDLSGALTYDPCIGDFIYVQEEVFTVPFVEANQNLFNFNESFMAELQSLHKSCGYEDFINQYLTFPPSGVQPPKFFNYSSDADCDLLTLADNAILEINPCFDIYEVTEMCPLLWDVLAFPTQLVYQPDGATIYFNRSDVKAALHAPQYVNWAECSVEPVFVGGNSGPEQEGDTSADPIQKVLPQVIEATNRVLVANGDYDMIIITNGTLLAIQNMTWNGALGFQSAPSTPINITDIDLQYQAVFAENGYEGIDGPQGIMGVQHYERGLMWAETYMSGHMQPQFQPRVSYRHIQWVLGRIDTL